MMSSPFHPITLFPVPEDYGSMFDFFCRCEQDQLIVTIPMIRDKCFPGDYPAAYRYVQRYWSWFLVCVNSDNHPYSYRVRGILAYPRVYFVDAHKPKMMQYFHHFVRSMAAHEEREKVSKGSRARPVLLPAHIDSEQPLPQQLLILTDLPLEVPTEEELNEDKEMNEDGSGEMSILPGTKDEPEDKPENELEDKPVIPGPPLSPPPPFRVFPALIVLGIIAVLCAFVIVYFFDR